MTRLQHGCVASPCEPESVLWNQQAERARLRRTMRQRRRAITGRLRRVLARRWAAQANPLLRRRGRIALYMASPEEMDVGVFLARARQRKRHVYLPVVRRGGHALVFRRLGREWVLNRYGIREPGYGEPRCEARFLSVVVVPLLAFDAQGHRLGMGGGYYDRTMAHRRWRHAWRRPVLIGAAYACQEVAHLQTMAWDVPLDAVITEQGWQAGHGGIGHWLAVAAAGENHAT